MVLIHGSPSSKHSYPKAKANSLDIFHSFKYLFIAPSHISLSQPLPLLCFQDDLEYHCVLMPQEAFVEYVQTIANGVVPASLELVLPQVCHVYHNF
jgi:hypothetical protein